MVVNFGGTTMESTSTRSNVSSTKTERKVIEKNRRNQMKTLYSKLNSLLPHQNFKEPLPLPDQIDEAISYIKSLEERLKKSKEKKESLTGSRKRSYTCTYDPIPIATPKSPHLQIQEVGSALEIALTSGLDNQFVFYEIIRILHEEGVDVVSANVQVLGDSIFHILHGQIKGSADGFGAAKDVWRSGLWFVGKLMGRYDYPMRLRHLSNAPAKPRVNHNNEKWMKLDGRRPNRKDTGEQTDRWGLKSLSTIIRSEAGSWWEKEIGGRNQSSGAWLEDIKCSCKTMSKRRKWASKSGRKAGVEGKSITTIQLIRRKKLH
ncbi:unnamed protein product [Dovyalis caffra]|uniref:BHLH domain-containing protein n=1 Tax=Dovyalis caffra TaxID=77055 RepID=A0AAV1QPZ0_9ROSI|nr:unnamed protein product [Dovyalis caffra]